MQSVCSICSSGRGTSYSDSVHEAEWVHITKWLICNLLSHVIDRMLQLMPCQMLICHYLFAFSFGVRCCCLAPLHASKRLFCAEWHTISICIVIVCGALLVLRAYELTPSDPRGYKWSLAWERHCGTALLSLGSFTAWLPSFIHSFVHLITHPFSESNDSDTEASRLWCCKLNMWRLLTKGSFMLPDDMNMHVQSFC